MLLSFNDWQQRCRWSSRSRRCCCRKKIKNQIKISLRDFHSKHFFYFELSLWWKLKFRRGSNTRFSSAHDSSIRNRKLSNLRAPKCYFQWLWSSRNQFYLVMSRLNLLLTTKQTHAHRARVYLPCLLLCPWKKCIKKIINIEMTFFFIFYHFRLMYI